MKYKYILFDMDGTVLSTLDDICDSVNATLEHFGYPLITLDQCRHYVGNASAKLIERALPEGTSPEKSAEVLEYYLPWYTAHSQIKTGPYPGIMELLRKIRDAGGHAAVISNKPDAACKKLSEHFFGDLAEITIGQSDRLARKPAPDMVYEAIRLLGAKKEDCIYVGDSDVDVMTAKNAGLGCISVLWGFRTKEEVEAAGATCFANTADELFELL